MVLHAFYFRCLVIFSLFHIYNRPPHKCSGYDAKQSDGEVPVILEHWGIQSTPSLTSLPGPLWARVVALDKVLSMGQIELNCILMLT